MDEFTTEELYEQSWEAHDHGDESPAHLHAVDADWSLGFQLQVNMVTEEKVDVVRLMEFRGLVMGMIERLENNKAHTSLSESSVNDQQFAILVYNIDAAFTDGLVNVIDKALIEQGVTPPCHLTKVDSSNIRSFGFVMVVADKDDEVPDRGTLYVAFHGDTLYAYEDVPVHEVDGFIAAESKGAYFQSAIRNGGYKFKKVVG
jgi:hypothetical protein